MPFVQRSIEPKYLSRTNLFDEDGKPRVLEEELQAVTNNTLCNALRQLASLVLAADDIFQELGGQLQSINKRSEAIKVKINVLEEKVDKYDPKEVTVPESDIATFALIKDHYTAKHNFETNLFAPESRPAALKVLYDAATKTPVHLMRHLDRWRRDGHRSSRFFLCTPVLGRKGKFRNNVDIEIETRMPAAVEELRRWTSDEALGDVTVAPDCSSRIAPNITVTDGYISDGTIASDDEGIDHKLPSPEEQLQVVALKFPAEIVAVDVSGKIFDRMSIQRRSLMHGDLINQTTDGDTMKRRTRNRKPRSRRRNTLAGTDHKEICNAVTAGEEPPSPSINHETESTSIGITIRSKSSDLLRSSSKKESPEHKKSHFNSLKQWGKSRYDKLMNKNSETKNEKIINNEDIDDFSVHETVTMKRKRDIDKERIHERHPSVSSSEKSSISIPVSNTLSSVMNIAVKLRESSAQRRQRRSGGNKDEPHSSSGNWSASSESGRASIASEITAHPKSTTSAATSNNSLNLQPSSVNSRRRFNMNASTSGSATSEGTLTPDIIHDLHEDGETSSVYSCDTEGYYTSFHVDSGLKTLKEEDTPPTPIHSTTAFSTSSSNNTAENEYELFGKGSTSTTTSSAGTVCTTLRASESNRSLIVGPAVPERKSSLSNKSEESTLERDFSDKTGTVKRSPATNSKPTIVALIHKQSQGDVSPDSGHNTSSSPIESINSPNGVRSGSDFEFSESSDMEGPERIERIRVKTTINSSRIPSMCVITPSHSDDESENSSNSSKNSNYQKQLQIKNKQNKIDLKNEFLKNVRSESIKENDHQPHIVTSAKNGSHKLSLISVNPVSGYATVETIDQPDGAPKTERTRAEITKDGAQYQRSLRAPSPSGGTVVVKEETQNSKSPSQPIIKASLMPLNTMFGKLRSNLANFTNRRDRSKSPSTNKDLQTNLDEGIFDSGEYVTIADVRNNNEKALGTTDDISYVNDVINKNLNSVLSGKIMDTEYVCLNDLPCNENNNISNSISLDSLERKRQGARVMLDAEGKVVYSSDSLKRSKGAHTTFEPGPHVKPANSPSPSPLPVHRIIKNIRPVNQNQQAPNPVESMKPLSSQIDKLVIRAASGMTSPTAEIVRMPPSTIVAPAMRPMSPKARGAYVHIQDAGKFNAAQEKDRVPSPAIHSTSNTVHASPERLAKPIQSPDIKEMYHYRDPIFDAPMDTNRYLSSQYYLQNAGSMYSTLPSKKTKFYNKETTERSVTPDITRGLERNRYGIDRTMEDNQHSLPRNFHRPGLSQNLGIPIQMPDINRLNVRNVPSNITPMYNRTQYYNPRFSQPNDPFSKIPSYVHYQQNIDGSNSSLKISPIDPRHSGAFQSSTPTGKTTELKAAINLENKLLSPKKSTMSNEELYAVIHKSKKKLNIETDDTPRSSPVTVEETVQKQAIKSPETGYLGEKARSRFSWSPSKGEYVDFNQDIDKLSPPNNDSRSRQSWACNDRKSKPKQTSTLDFKRLLLQKSSSNSSKKISAVEQLKLSKEQIKTSPSKHPPEMNILDLSSSPRSLVNRRFLNNPPGSPNREPKPPAKILSPRSQWRFASPRSDVLSSTILEDCREDESPNSSSERRNSPKVVSSTPKKETSPKGMPRNQLEDKPYTSATQRLYAQRAQFFNQPPRSPPKTREIQGNTSPPTLETAF